MTIGELATLGTAIAMALAAIGAGVAFGWLSQRVTQVEHRVDELGNELRSEIAAVRGEIAELRNEMRSEIAELRNEMRAGFAELRAQIEETNRRIEETNRILVGLANHRHDTDGTTVFTIPQP